jgi:predicted RNase H-like nuclease
LLSWKVRVKGGLWQLLVDALTLAVAAFLTTYGLATLPAVPEVDSKGLRMEMVYTGLASLNA